MNPSPVPSAAAVGGGAAMSAAGGLPLLTPAYLQAHVVGTSGKDVIWGPLYDALAYPSAGGIAFTFFQTGIGSGNTSSPGAGAGAKTVYDTNLRTPQMLTMGNEFYAIGSETHILPGVQPTTGTPYALLPGRSNIAPGTAPALGSFVDDVWAIANGGLKVLTVGTDRKYINDGPLLQFPPSKWLHVSAALAEIGPSSTSTGTAQEISYACAAGEPYLLVPIYLQSTQQFALDVTFPVAIPTPSQAPGRLIERIRGYLIRQIT